MSKKDFSLIALITSVILLLAAFVVAYIAFSLTGGLAFFLGIWSILFSLGSVESFCFSVTFFISHYKLEI